MNILDITNEDIARLQENKIVFGLLPEMDRKIFGFIGTGNTDRYCSTGFYRCRDDSIFQESAVYRIVSDYALPTLTEADIIAYLQASEVPPSQWPKAVQEWASDKVEAWEWFNGKKWYECRWIGFDKDNYSIFPHRLRADYGEKKLSEPNGYYDVAKYYEDEPKPEVCEWTEIKNVVYVSPHYNNLTLSPQWIKNLPFCPVCGKRIKVKDTK